ncbi:transcriptional regulator [Bacteroidia bacterium]|nr:transcriptional regulator [Bacteroidia bacterium]GHV45086.1 transcriptional regulator [Bacteroidia bacterium]
MKIDTNTLNKNFDNRNRLLVMSLLSVNKSLSFNELKESLQLTDGNLASTIKALEELQYLSVMKGFIGRKTNTLYTITQDGKQAFEVHLQALDNLIKSTQKIN